LRNCAGFWEIHSFSTAIHSQLTIILDVFFSKTDRTLSCKAIQPNNSCGKKKNQKIWAVNVEKCYFVGITGKIGSIP
jgi:hypothetical protein